VKLFRSLSQLLQAYRETLPGKTTQERISQDIGISSRTWRRWESVDRQSRLGKSDGKSTGRAGRSGGTKKRGNKREAKPPGASIRELEKVAKHTLIPFEALLRLRHGYPTLFDFRMNRYSTCPFDPALVNARVLKKQLLRVEDVGLVEQIESRDWPQILDVHDRLFRGWPRLDRGVLLYGASVLRELNLIVRDVRGLYAGHMIVLPLAPTAHGHLRDRHLRENELTRSAIATGDQFPISALHIYVFSSIQSTYAYRLLRRFTEALVFTKANLSPEVVLSRYAETRDARALSHHLGLTKLGRDETYQNRYKLPMTPEWYEGKISSLPWFRDAKSQLSSGSAGARVTRLHSE
jgi:hypothetical protein